MPTPPARPGASDTIISERIDRGARRIHAALAFIARYFREAVKPPFHLDELVRQCFVIGVKTLPLITLTGFITGLVFTRQSRPSLAAFGATSWLPSLITIALVRSLAPLITALICAGRVGSNIGAELGSMRVTEQIDAMEVSALNPFKVLVVTRATAAMLTVPALTLYCCFVGLAGAWLNVHAGESTSIPAFITAGFRSISFLDVWSSFGKTFLFGLTIGLISAYQGFHASAGTAGVGRAANASVVTSMFAIFIEELIVVQIITWTGGY